MTKAMTGMAADIVIVGSGPTGSAMARILHEKRPDLSVLMLEAGPIVSDPPGHHLDNVADAATRTRALSLAQGPEAGKTYAPRTDAEWLDRLAGRADASMLRRPGLFLVGREDVEGGGFPAAHAASAMGGMGTQWYGASPRFFGQESIPFIEEATMLAAYADGERLLKVSTNQFPESQLAAVLKGRLGAMFDPGRPSDRRVQAMPMAMVRATGRGVLRSGVDVILGSLLTEPSSFEYKTGALVRRILVENGTARGVVYEDTETNDLVEVSARVVAVCADALHTPQLLYASGIHRDTVGRYLNEHPFVAMMAEVADAPTTDELGHVTWIPYVDDSFPYSVMIRQFDPAAELSHDLTGGDRSRPWVTIGLFNAADVCARNRVVFSDHEVDWRGMPAISTRYEPTDDDRRRLEHGCRIVERIAEAIGRPLLGHAPAVMPFGSSLHYQGTVRMGAADDGTSVCDPAGRVWGTSNLYVGGNGVIPTRTSGNPTLTAVAVAVISASEIAATL